MALIKCPECDSKISDQAEMCPKCGYELKKKSNSNEKLDNYLKKFNGKWDNKYLIFLILIIGVVIFMFTRNNNSSGNNNNNNNNSNNNYNNNTVPPSTNNGYSVYKDSNLGVSFEIPSNYKVTTDKDGFVYVGQNIDNNGALIPYIIIGKYNNFNNPTQFLNSFTEYMRKGHSDLVITVDLLSGVIGGRTVYGLAYNYYIDGHLVVDNRYAVAINNMVYMVGTKEENVNSQEINSVTNHILETMTEGGN